ncbi:MAG TPA: hypothetical protein VF004_10975 [Burkholderiales bacterium]
MAVAAQAAEVELVRDGKPQAVSAAAQARIARDLPRLFASCSINSRHHPEIISVERQTDRKDRLVLRLDTPVHVGHPSLGAIVARELVVGLPKARYPGPFLSRNEGNVVAYTKCDGGQTIRFVCAPETKALMPASYLEACKLL